MRQDRSRRWKLGGATLAVVAVVAAALAAIATSGKGWQLTDSAEGKVVLDSERAELSHRITVESSRAQRVTWHLDIAPRNAASAQVRAVGLPDLRATDGDRQLLLDSTRLLPGDTGVLERTLKVACRERCAVTYELQARRSADAPHAVLDWRVEALVSGDGKEIPDGELVRIADESSSPSRSRDR